MQAANAPVSTEHSNVEPVSEEENAKLASVELETAAGLLVIVVAGGVVSAAGGVVAPLSPPPPQADKVNATNVDIQIRIAVIAIPLRFIFGGDSRSKDVEHGARRVNLSRYPL